MYLNPMWSQCWPCYSSACIISGYLTWSLFARTTIYQNWAIPVLILWMNLPVSSRRTLWSTWFTAGCNELIGFTAPPPPALDSVTEEALIGIFDDANTYTSLKFIPPTPIGEGKANATLVFLARNSDLDGVLSSMAQMERRFNKKYGYPWVFLNEENFTDEFKTWAEPGLHCQII